MSICYCEMCERTVDTDFEPMYADTCEYCAQHVVDTYNSAYPMSYSDLAYKCGIREELASCIVQEYS